MCFEVDEVGDGFAYGRFECDTSIAYRGGVVFGTMRIVEDETRKARFVPRLDEVTLYAVTPGR